MAVHPTLCVDCPGLIARSSMWVPAGSREKNWKWFGAVLTRPFTGRAEPRLLFTVGSEEWTLLHGGFWGVDSPLHNTLKLNIQTKLYNLDYCPFHQTLPYTGSFAAYMYNLYKGRLEKVRTKHFITLKYM